MSYDVNQYVGYTVDELEAMPTLAQGQADDLKIENGDDRVWLSRCGVEDGEPWDNKVTLEHNIDGRWTEVAIWPAPAFEGEIVVVIDPRTRECEGHPAGPFDPMGETVYCDGSCKGRAS